MLLSKLTPAETLLIRDGREASIKDLLKYTLMDLLLKQVLVTENVPPPVNRNGAASSAKYVATGKNFNGYACLTHELMFVSWFHRNPDMMILFRNCVQMAYENAGSKNALHKTIRLSPALDGAFSTTFFQQIFGGYSYTAGGLTFKREVAQEIRQLEEEVPYLLASNRERALTMLKLIGGNIFLLQGVDFALLKEIDEAFARENHNTSAGGCSTWTTFDTFSGDFDNSCSASHDSGGCSSGDSGCGGGCGGD